MEEQFLKSDSKELVETCKLSYKITKKVRWKIQQVPELKWNLGFFVWRALVREKSNTPLDLSCDKDTSTARITFQRQTANGSVCHYISLHFWL